MTDMGPMILYVDDDRSNRIVFEHSFRQRFHVRCVASGAEALDILNEKGGEVGVLIADQRMPGMSGNELLTRAKDSFPDVVRIVITAYSELDPILRAVNEGLVARYLLKPWDRDQLEAVLAWAVELFTMGRHSSATQLRLLEAERLATIGSLQASVLHDLNQPLAHMSANVGALRRLAEAAPALGRLIREHGADLAAPDRERLVELAEELQGMAEDLEDGCTHLRSLSRGVRDILRAEPTEARTEPHQAIRFAMSVCRHAADGAGARLDYEAPSELPPVSISHTGLLQVLINLVSNAVQAVSRRETRGGRVLLRVEDRGDHVCFDVEDDGPGMPADVLANIGKPFFTTRKEGTGLGMHQCRRLVEGAGGTLGITSTVGVGTRVQVLLPVAR